MSRGEENIGGAILLDSRNEVVDELSRPTAGRNRLQHQLASGRGVDRVPILRRRRRSGENVSQHPLRRADVLSGREAAVRLRAEIGVTVDNEAIRSTRRARDDGIIGARRGSDEIVDDRADAAAAVGRCAAGERRALRIFERNADRR